MKVLKPYGVKGEPLPMQLRFHRSSAKFRAYIGGYGSGKTTCGCEEGLSLSLEYPGTVGIVCRRTYPELKDSTQKAFFQKLASITEELTGHYGDEAEPRSCPLVLKYNKNENKLTIYTGRDKPPSIILFRSLDKNWEKLKSMEIGWFWIDEASDTKEESFLALIGRLRIPVQEGGYTGFLTSNPCTKRHWIYNRFVKGVDKDASYALFKAPTTENIHLPKGYIESLYTSLPPAMAERYILGKFGIIPNGKPVYPDFDMVKHVSSTVKYKSRINIVRSWDFGWNNPSCLIGQIDGDRLILLAEISGKNELIGDFAKRVLKFCNENFGISKYEDYCDPAGNQKGDKNEKTSIQILKSLCIYPRSSWQPIKDGVLIVSMLLQNRPDGMPGLFVHPRCEVLVEGFCGGYHFPKDFVGSEDDMKPVKDNTYDHLQDCLRYLVWNTKFKTWLKKIKAREEDRNSFNAVRRRAIRAKQEALV